VDARVEGKRDGNSEHSHLGLFEVLFASGSFPIGNFSDAQIEYLKLLIENRDLEAELNRQRGEDPDRTPPQIHFVDISIDEVREPETRRVLNSTPTSFKLSTVQVDQLRAAGAEVLCCDSDFQNFLSGLRN
jgi:hypothetical protein